MFPEVQKQYIRRSFFLVLLLFPGTFSYPQEYAIGADLSFLQDAEENGFIFRENNEVRPGLIVFRDHGYNWIRLRLFHSPTGLPNDLEYTIRLAKKAKKLGYKFLLDFHYSDTWADPSKQYLPAAWETFNKDQLVKAVYEYTGATLGKFRDEGVLPEMVQIGNEVINGMLWIYGKLPGNGDNFADLVKAGIAGVKSVSDTIDIMIHIDQGGNKEKTRHFFDKLLSYGVDFDCIGQSYYPWWHGSILDLRENMIFMAETYRKPIILVEVAYCATPTEYKDRPAPFPETPEGQKEFLEEVNRIVLSTPANLGRGIFWWEPATRNGSSARDFFDENSNVLPVITVFDKYVRH